MFGRFSIWAFKESQLVKKKIKTPSVQGSKRAQTRVQFFQCLQYISLKNGISFSTLNCAENMWKLPSYPTLLGFSIGLTLGVKYDSILAVRSSNICEKLFTDIGVPRIGSFREKQNGFFLRKRPTVDDLFEGPWLVRTHLRRYSARPRTCTNKTRYEVCHSLLLFIAVSVIRNIWHSSRKGKRHSWMTKFGSLPWTSSCPKCRLGGEMIVPPIPLKVWSV